MMRVVLISALLAVLTGILPTMAQGMPQAGPHQSVPLQVRLARIETRLADENQAAERQADAFDAAAKRIEIVNAAVVLVIALAGLGGSILAIKWVRHTAHEQIATQVAAAVEDTGKEAFEVEAAALRDDYETKFAALYRRYSRLEKRP